MINPKKLKLGNLFVEQKTRNILKVIELSETKVVFSGLFKSGWQAEPIPLTEEWLPKLGFSHFGQVIAFMEDKCIYRDFSISKFELENLKIHEFQNLVFDLTKKELQYNEEIN